MTLYIDYDGNFIPAFDCVLIELDDENMDEEQVEEALKNWNGPCFNIAKGDEAKFI